MWYMWLDGVYPLFSQGRRHHPSCQEVGPPLKYPELVLVQFSDTRTCSAVSTRCLLSIPSLSVQAVRGFDIFTSSWAKDKGRSYGAIRPPFVLVSWLGMV